MKQWSQASEVLYGNIKSIGVNSAWNISPRIYSYTRKHGDNAKL
jgi:hypothetical protein